MSLKTWFTARLASRAARRDPARALYAANAAQMNDLFDQVKHRHSRGPASDPSTFTPRHGFPSAQERLTTTPDLPGLPNLRAQPWGDPLDPRRAPAPRAGAPTGTCTAENGDRTRCGNKALPGMTTCGIEAHIRQR